MSDKQVDRTPKDWKFCCLKDVIIKVIGGGTPSRFKDVYWSGNIPWASVKDFNDDVQIISNTEEYISKIGLKNSSANLIEPNIPLICTRMAVGRIAFSTKAIAINQDLKALYLSDEINKNFFIKLIVLFRYKIESIAIGSTVKGIRIEELLSFKFNNPPLPEQKQIAKILDTIDELITVTETQINKLKKIKEGLLDDLLIKGIDDNGELRDPSKHPEQFKDSPLGKIPKDWNICQLLEMVPYAEYGISVSLDDNEGIPVLRMNNLINGEIDLKELKYSVSSQAKNLLLKNKDVLFNRTNSIDHVGRTSIWREQLSKASFASYLVRLIPNKSKIIPEYLNIWLNLPSTQIIIRQYATPSVHQVNINPTNLRKTLIFLPKQTLEQQKIIEKVESQQTDIQIKQTRLEKLKLLKKGLMNDLLTGKVRVKILPLE